MTYAENKESCWQISSSSDRVALDIGGERSSDLIRSAVAMTAQEWLRRYGEIPTEPMRTEIRPAAVQTEVPGYCYRRAGWVRVPSPKGMVYLRCPAPQIQNALTNRTTA